MNDTGVKATQFDDTTEYKSVMLFGTDIRQIPCFRLSFVYGICGGVAGGLLSFLATSKAKFSMNVSFVSAWVIIFGYWIPCRYNYEVNEMMVEQWKRNLKKESPIIEESETAK